LQDRKQAFLDGKSDTAIYSSRQLQTPRSPYELMAGTVIAAALVTGLNSDLPGQVIAQVTEDIYDSVTGQTLHIPQGSRLMGKYDSIVAYGQSRVLLIWTRLLMPDGSSIILDNLPAADTQGYAGLKDGVDYHSWRLLEGIALSTLLGVGSELGATNNDNAIVKAATELFLLSRRWPIDQPSLSRYTIMYLLSDITMFPISATLTAALGTIARYRLKIRFPQGRPALFATESSC